MNNKIILGLTILSLFIAIIQVVNQKKDYNIVEISKITKSDNGVLIGDKEFISTPFEVIDINGNLISEDYPNSKGLWYVHAKTRYLWYESNIHTYVYYGFASGLDSLNHITRVKENMLSNVRTIQLN
jgi:hypothetical protein